MNSRCMLRRVVGEGAVNQKSSFLCETEGKILAENEGIFMELGTEGNRRNLQKLCWMDGRRQA